jgi:prepilin-type N-terminal cleavage/methylation domain-containing protein
VFLIEEIKMRYGKGITLIELLIVVLILGALAAIAIPRIGQTSTTAKENACKTNVDLIQTQVELYIANHGSTPSLPTLFADPNYFPQGEPNCAVDSTKGYTIDGDGKVSCSGCAW